MKRKNGVLTRILVAGALICLCLCWAGAALAQEPSFDCSKAKTKIEKAICRDEGLSALDRDLTEIYKDLWNKQSDIDRGLLKTRQVEWMWQRDRNCGAKKEGADTTDCLREIYLKRIADLKEWQKTPDTKKDKESGGLGGKCWKRTKPPWPGGEGNYPLCRAFEEVLNTTCEPPKKLICNWTLPPGEKRFRKLRWEPLDPKENWELVIALVTDVKYREYQWEHRKQEIQEKLRDGLLWLEMGRADVDRDGVVENIVRLRRGVCGQVGWKVLHGVILPDTRRLEEKESGVFKHVNASHGGEIILFDGTAFMFGWTYGQDAVRIWEGYSSTSAHYTGSVIVCDFKYIGRHE